MQGKCDIYDAKEKHCCALNDCFVIKTADKMTIYNCYNDKWNYYLFLQQSVKKKGFWVHLESWDVT